MVNLSTNELCPSELSFVQAMQKLGFGQFEDVLIVAGELVLDPWPRTVQSVKFGSAEQAETDQPSEFDLKRQVAEFIVRIRAIENGEIRTLEIRHGLPFAMQMCTGWEAGPAVEVAPACQHPGEVVFMQTKQEERNQPSIAKVSARIVMQVVTVLLSACP